MSQHLSPRAKYNIADIQNLLEEVFNDEELTSFCYYDFEMVHRNFTDGMTFRRKVQLLIEYCERHDSIDRLLSRVRDLRPEIPGGEPIDFGVSEIFANTAYDLAQDKRYAEAIERIEAGLTYCLNRALAMEETEDQYKITRILEALGAARGGDRHEAPILGGLTFHDIIQAVAYAPLVYLVTTCKGSLAFILLSDCTGLAEARCNCLDDLLQFGLNSSPETQAEVSVGIVRMNGFTGGNLKDLLVEVDDSRRITGGYLLAQCTGTVAMRPVLDAVLETLGDRLIGRLAKGFRALGFKQLTFLPFSQLSVLPLHASHYEGKSGPSHLTDEFEVTYAPSVEAFSSARNRVAQSKGRRGKLLSVGCEANAFSQEEAGAVARIAAASPSPPDPVVFEPVVTPQLLLDQAANAQYLHLACSIIVDATHPLESTIVLSQSATLNLDDLVGAGRLKSAQLVTLSAVQPPRIDIDQLSEVSELLCTSFLKAGAANVVSNLWLSNDLSTSLLVKQFYTYHFQDGLTPAAALRRAQRWLREEVTAGMAAEICHRRVQSLYNQRSPALAQAIDDWMYYDRLPPDSHPFAHPVYWAAFIISGA